jgi:hypothetical protein
VINVDPRVLQEVKGLLETTEEIAIENGVRRLSYFVLESLLDPEKNTATEK